MARRAVGWLLYFLMRAVVLLPLRLQLRLGMRLGAVVYRVLAQRRRVAERNLRLCFPELTEEERERLLRAHFRALGASIVETAMGWFGSKEVVRRHIRVEGEEHLTRALEAGKGVILYSAHFTTFEFFFPQLELMCPTLCGMYKPQRNATMDELVRRGRLRNFDELFPKDAVRSMLRRLAGNAVVWYAPDQSYARKHSVLLPFFGEPAMTNTSLSRIARISGAVVLPYFCRRADDGPDYVMSIGAPLDDFPSGDSGADTRRLTKLLEDFVRTCPEQYLWVHERFKGRPAPYGDAYADLRGAA